MNILRFIKALIEELWQVLVIIWNLPVGIIEIVWNAIFDRKKLARNWLVLKDAIKGKNTMSDDGRIS